MWKNVKKSKPNENILVKVKHMITGNGAPEREGWESVGFIRSNGTWNIRQNDNNTVDFRTVTHWDYLQKENL